MANIQRPELLIFDVNETLLDMSPVKEQVNKALENDFAFNCWFPQLLNYAMVETITGTYHSFGEIAAATLNMTAHSLGRELKEEQISAILESLSVLPPHSEVEQALIELQKAGFKLVALTNGAPSVAKQQMEYAGLSNHFARIFSVEEVKAFKPSAKTYRYVLSEMKVEAQNAMMVAAHGWDIAGAQSAGLQAAFIARKGKSMYPLADEPEMNAKDLTEFSSIILNSVN